MNVVIFVELFKPYSSGVVVSVEMLTNELLKRGHKPFIFTPRVPAYKDKEKVPVIRIPSFPIFGKRFAIPFLTKRLEREVKKLNPQLIHIQGPYPTGILGVLLGQRLKIPVIMTYHAHVLKYLESWTTVWNWIFTLLIAKPLALLIIRWIAKRCRFVISPSNFIKNVLEDYGIDSGKIRVLPTAVVAPSLESFPSKRDLNLPTEGKILIYVGRISKEKNLEMLLAAFEKIVNERQDVILIFIGEGPLIGKLKKIVSQKGLADWVFFLGKKSHQEIWSFLKVSDVFVFPSLSETQGLSVAEAMLVGLPVVVVNQGGAPEFIDNKESGLLVPNDSEEFAKAVLTILESPGFASYLGVNAQKKISENLNPDVLYRKMEELYLQSVKELGPAVR